MHSGQRDRGQKTDPKETAEGRRADASRLSGCATSHFVRDLLMLLIPIWGLVVHVQTVWRYTAKNIYWSMRSDRPSGSLFAAS